jgi:hypothetical protein
MNHVPETASADTSGFGLQEECKRFPSTLKNRSMRFSLYFIL